VDFIDQQGVLLEVGDVLRPLHLNLQFPTTRILLTRERIDPTTAWGVGEKRLDLLPPPL
jgi:hypothetical protein